MKCFVHSKFSCVHSSHNLCANAHVHSLEGALVPIPTFLSFDSHWNNLFLEDSILRSCLAPFVAHDSIFVLFLACNIHLLSSILSTVALNTSTSILAFIICLPQRFARHCFRC